MDGVMALNELNDLQKRATGAVKVFREHGIELARLDAFYKEAYTEEILKLRADGMAVTIIEKVAQGNIAHKRLKRDIAEVNYKASQEELYNLRLKIRVLEAQIKMEWFNNE